MKTFKNKILTVVTLLILTACNTAKYVNENEYLLKNSSIKIDGKKTTNPEITSYQIQRPNTTILGIPLGLHFYNIGNPNYDSIYLQKKSKLEKQSSLISKIISKKQSYKLINKRKKLNNWFLTRGEQPSILDDHKSTLTANKLRTHFFNKGYFNATVKTTTIRDDQNALVTYSIDKKEPFKIGKISYNISSPVIDSILNKDHVHIALKEGKQYDLENFKKTITNISETLRNNGIYHFRNDLISFRGIDTIAKNNITPVIINIENRKIKQKNEVLELPTKQQTIKKINVYTDYSYNERNKSYNTKETRDSIQFFAHSKLKHKTKTLSNSIFIKPNEVYSDEKIELTRQHLRSLNNFKSVKINIREIDDENLEASIVLNPLKKYGIGINTEIIHSNIKQLGLSGGFSFINRNTFGGAEIFKLSLQGSIFDTATKVSGEESTSFDAYEVGIDASLEFPKFIFPFLGNLIPRTMTPKTKVSIGTSFQKNIGLDKQKISGIIDYNWKSSRKNSHTFEILNLQFINNLNTESYYNIYSSEFRRVQSIKSDFNLLPSFVLTTANTNRFIQSIPGSFNTTNPEEFTTLKNIEKREDIITSNNLIPSTSYSFEHNSRKGLADTNYNFFRTEISTSGNLSSFFFNQKNGSPVFEDIEISQFVKLDIDFRKFWNTSNNNSIAFRTFLGAAIPTGKNKEIPFITSYFAGGSNDIRAWKTYELGPGNSNTGLEFNIGNLKLLSSLEYRFKVINSIHGALFIDAGNIWNLPNTSTAEEKEIFNNIKSLENIAVGSGMGIRYDFNFLVLRLDWAFKTFEPYLKSNRWFSNYRIADSVLNIGINYPF
ncbi:translocation and assembly module lipoprotein TamL [Wenyingzhuangia sp. IMCC45574]